MLTRSEDFITYAMNDAVLLPIIFKKKIEVNNQIIKDFINISDDVFTWNNMPMPTTVGATVFKECSI